MPASNHVALRGAGGEWLDFLVQEGADATALRVAPLQRIDKAAPPQPIHARIYQVADVQSDTNRAAYLRLYGGAGGKVRLPRALLPLTLADGTFQLPAEIRGQRGRFWIDLEVPRGIERGRWQTTLSALDERGRAISTLRVELETHGFDLPVERSLIISAPVEWDRLVALWPEEFRGISPALLARTDGRTSPAVAVLDSLVAQAQQDRVQVTLPALGGIVKWPAGHPPEADWREFDALVFPWLTGEAFADGVGLRGWPVPQLNGMQSYSDAARAQYWQAAIAHLEERGLLHRCVVFLNDELLEPGPMASRRQIGLSPMDRMSLSQEAGRIARLSQAGRIALPLESDQVRFTGPEHPDMFPPEEARRLVIRADGLVTSQATRPWPAGLPQPERYLDGAASSPVPAPRTGAREADVRLWGWLAFLRGAVYVNLDDPLPPGGQLEPVDPTQLTWFYPGEMFGRDEPVPTVALKWLRRAQQDYEYLAAASHRGEETYARVIARALVRPVRVEEAAANPVLPMLAGTFDAALWSEGLALVADKVAIADARIAPGLAPRFAADHTNRTTTWISPRERPVPVISRTQWDLHADSAGRQRLVLGLSMNVYNPSDARPEGISLLFTEMPGGEAPERAVWENPGRIVLPAIATYEVGNATLSTSATIDELALVFPTFQQGPMHIAARNEYSGAQGIASAVAPAMVIDQRRQAPVIDGQLAEWLGNEAIIDGRMVQMHSRPALQAGEVLRAPKPAQSFVGWSSEGLHIAFRLEDAGAADAQLRATRNFVDTEHRRVWGEDVCEVLIQPVWSNGQAVDGPLLHLVCKPDGAFLRRRTDRRAAAQPWQNFESGMQYAATVDEAGVWRGEVTLPWSALRDQVTEQQLGDGGREARPALLRFNLSHHDGETGRSASWAGPVDFGADEHFTGALILRTHK